MELYGLEGKANGTLLTLIVSGFHFLYFHAHADALLALALLNMTKLAMNLEQVLLATLLPIHLMLWQQHPKLLRHPEALFANGYT